MKISIERFPDAEFNPSTNEGFLARYYAINSGLDTSQWRNTYSPDILDFKEGKPEDIKYFVPPFLLLIRYVLKHFGLDSAVIVPAPSSRAKDDPSYSNAPYVKGTGTSRKNRDDRCLQFCNLLSDELNQLVTAELVVRKKSKQEKSGRNRVAQLSTLEIDEQILGQFLDAKAFILIDDVRTTGSTFEAMEKVIRSRLSDVKIIKLSIGKTFDASDISPFV